MRVLQQCLLWIFLVPIAFAATAPSHPNIVVITIDTTRADRMGFLGSNRGLTPNLDGLAKQAVVFERAYAQVPLTAPSHATIFTGTYPQFNHVTIMGESLSADLPYLPDLLHRNGYRTAAFVGSFILDPKDVARGFNRGFDVYDGTFRQRHHGEDRYQTLERRADTVVDHALAWLAKRPPGPFMLWVHFYDPHEPYDPPEPYKSHIHDPYDGEIAYTDAAVGRLLSALRARQLLDGAAVAVMADHGEAFGEHGEYHHGVFLYDETVHVPLLMKLPKQRAAGTRVNGRVQLVDVAPTLLEEAGIAAPAAMQGKSLLDLMATASQHAERPAYSESKYARRAFGWSSLQAWRAGKYLYIEAPQKELYDQSIDPGESRNLAASSTAVTETMATQAKDFRARTASAAPHPSAPLTEEQASNLRALGYLASSSASVANEGKQGPDPKEKIALANVFHDALIDVEQENYESAAVKLEQVLKEEPNATMAYFELGRAYVRIKEYQKAIPPLEKALELAPEDGLAHYELAQALVKTGRWADSIPHFEFVARQASSSPAMHFYLAVAYQQTDQLPGAMKEFRKTLQLDDRNFKANLLLGRLLGMQGDAKAAMPFLQKAVQLDPDSVQAHTFLANVYTQLGENAKAQRERLAAQNAKGASNP